MTTPAAHAHASPALRFRDVALPQDEELVRRMVDATGFFRPDEADVAAELVRERLNRGAESGYHFLFAHDPHDRTIGYACFGPIGCTLGSFDVYWIVVDPAQQRAGVGRALLEESERRIAALGGRRVYVETSSQPKYEPTRRFYLRTGYAEEARLRDFYDVGDDKVVYVKALTSGAR